MFSNEVNEDEMTFEVQMRTVSHPNPPLRDFESLFRDVASIYLEGVSEVYLTPPKYIEAKVCL